VGEFVFGAHWAGANLPDSAAVFTRKPRLYYVLSGVRSLTFPLSPDPRGFFDLAVEKGISYVVLDRVDGLSSRYVVPVVQARPGGFCSITGWAAGDGGRTELLGMPGTAQDSRLGTTDEGAPTVEIAACAEGMVRGQARPWPDYSSSQVPLLSAVP
jgi:hypothetical protein